MFNTKMSSINTGCKRQIPKGKCDKDNQCHEMSGYLGSLKKKQKTKLIKYKEVLEDGD